MCETIENQGLYYVIVGKADNIKEVWSLIFSLGEYRAICNNIEDGLHHNTVSVYKVIQSENAQRLSGILDLQKGRYDFCPCNDLWDNWLYLSYIGPTNDNENDTSFFSAEVSTLINHVIKESINIL